MTRRALLVLGMHRSGTSALTGLLVHLGAQGPTNLIPADEDNPLGYWESAVFNDFHERLLHSAGSCWDAWTRISPSWLNSTLATEFSHEFRALLEQEFGSAGLFVVKDPRICRFVPFWLRNLEAQEIAPAAILVVRSPFDVALSLEARDGLGREHSLLIWLRHMLEAEFETRTINRSLVRYRDLLEDWTAVADRISNDISVEWCVKSQTADAAMEHLVNPALCHHATGTPIDVAAPLSDWVKKACDAFDGLLEPNANRTNEALDALDEVRGAFDRSSEIFGHAFERERHVLRRRALSLEAERTELHQHVSNFEAERTELRQSVSSLEAERTELRQHVSSLEAERRELLRHASSLDAERMELRQRATSLEAQRSELRQHANDLEKRSDELASELARSRHHVDALLGSASWRLMAPFRMALRFLMRDQKGPASGRAAESKRDS